METYNKPSPVTPDRGEDHHHFKLYALRSPLKLPAADKPALLQATESNVLAMAQTVVTYEWWN